MIAEHVNVANVRSVTRVLDTWGKRIFNEIKTLLHSQPNTLLPDYSRYTAVFTHFHFSLQHYDSQDYSDCVLAKQRTSDWPKLHALINYWQLYWMIVHPLRCGVYCSSLETMGQEWSHIFFHECMTTLIS